MRGSAPLGKWQDPLVVEIQTAGGPDVCIPEVKVQARHVVVGLWAAATVWRRGHRYAGGVLIDSLSVGGSLRGTAYPPPQIHVGAHDPQLTAPIGDSGRGARIHPRACRVVPTSKVVSFRYPNSPECATKEGSNIRQLTDSGLLIGGA
jgi:hypothetical protein